MKSFVFAILCLYSVIAFAQQKPANKYSITDNTVVRDSSGFQYPTSVWRYKLSTHNYKLRLIDPKAASPEFLLVKLTDKEKQEKLAAMRKPRESTAFTTGDQFTTFRLTDMEGNKFRSKDLAGKVIVMNFWFINCPPCRKEIPELNELVNQYKNNPEVVFIAVALDENWDLKQFLKQTPYNYHIVSNRDFARSSGITQFPTHVVIDKKNTIRFHTVGLAGNTIYWLNKSIDESLAD